MSAAGPILVPVDFSPVTELLLREAERLARALAAPITVLHVADPEPDFVGYDPGPQHVRDAVAREHHEQHKQVQELAEGLRADGLDAKALCVQGPIVEKVLEVAAREGAGHLVVGTHGRTGLERLLLGSVAEEIVRQAPCPVLVIPSRLARPEQPPV